MLSPEQIRKRALNGYEDFLRSLAAAENIFPLSLFGGGLSRVTDYTKARDAIVAQIPVGRIGTPEDLWLAVKFCLECDYFNARTFDVDGGMGF